MGDVQLSRQGASTLRATEKAIVPYYVKGLRAEGSEITADEVRRAHAIQLMLYTGLSTLPFEHFDSAPTPALHLLKAERAAIARFSLDLLDTTKTSHG